MKTIGPGGRPLRILILEDVSADAELMERKLREGGVEFTSRRVETERAYRDALEEYRPDVILADYTLPSFDGLSALRITAAKYPEVPFLFVSGTVGEEIAVEAVREGASDYIHKDRLGRLGPALRRALRDVEERAMRRQAEESLRKSEMYNRHLLDNLPQRIFLKDRNSTYLSCNAIYARDLGIEPGEIVGKDDYAFHSHELADAYRADDKAVIDDGTTKDIDERYSVEGKDFWVHTVKVPWRDEAGNAIGVLGIFEDITDRKKTEEERHKLEEQLLQSQKMEAIGRLAGGIAHDFNNLLTAIGGYSELLLTRLSTRDPLRREVEEIRRAGQSATALTRQLLAFSRKQVLRPRVMNLNSLVADMDRMLGRLIGEDVELVTRVAPDLWSVKADPGQMEQVLMNLAVNARDAMPRGGKLTVETANVVLDDVYSRTHAIDAPGPYVMIAVTDTGCGMDSGTLARIFDPFFTTKETGKGTGLGLSTVHGIVKQSGGHIWVYSELARGTTFKIYFPRVEEASETAAPRESPEPLRRGRETILVAEDFDLVGDLVREILTMSGYKVLTAGSGGEAVQVAERHDGPIHLLLTDVVMPVMGGRELVERLASLKPGLKFIYMSGYTENAIVHHGVLDPGIDFLEKPFTPESLLRKVREVLDR